MNFIFDTYKTDFDTNLLNLPKNCDINNKCSTFSFCGALRNKVQEY